MKRIACRSWFSDVMFMGSWVCVLLSIACVFLPEGRTPGVMLGVVSLLFLGLGLWGRRVRRDIRSKRPFLQDLA